MSGKVTVVIDKERCIGCGACVRDCPVEALGMMEGKACVTGAESLGCGHCAAVCPTDAITVGAIDEGQWRFETFTMEPTWLPWGEGDTAALVRLMASRRSCRSYRDEPVPREMLADLVKIATTAPSGTNSQKWTFTILPARRDVLFLGERVAAFFDRLNRLSESALLRGALRLVGRPELARYHERLYPTIKKGLEEWRQEGKDLLFRGASAVICVGEAPGASTGYDDALLATQNILLGAHTMGLGTCLIGFASGAMSKDASIQKALGIPPKEKVRAVIALGWPACKYLRVTGRAKVRPRWFEAPDESCERGGLENER